MFSTGGILPQDYQFLTEVFHVFVLEFHTCIECVFIKANTPFFPLSSSFPNPQYFPLPTSCSLFQSPPSPLSASGMLIYTGYRAIHGSVGFFSDVTTGKLPMLW